MSPALIVALLALLLGVQPITTDLYLPALPGLAAHLGAGIGGAQATLSALIFAFGLSQLLLGPMADRFGRRPVLLISMFGHGLDFILMALAPTMWWLFVGRTISGITAASFSTANAYIADITPPKERAQRYGLVGAAFGFGFVFGPALGGIAGEFDPRMPFWIAAALCLLNAAYGWFVLPESLPPERRSAFSAAKANPLGSLGFLRAHGEVAWLAAVSIIWNTAFWVIPTTSVLYTAFRFGWTERDVGLMLAAIGIGNIVVQSGLVRPTVRFLGEALALRTGLGFSIAAMLVYAFAWEGWMFLLGIVFQSAAGIMGPALQALMSRRVSGTDQGKLQGALSSAIGIAGMFGPIIFSQVFAWALGPGAVYGVPGAAFLVSALFYLAALGVAWAATRER